MRTITCTGITSPAVCRFVLLLLMVSLLVHFSVNYMHHGAAKQWYGVPGRKAELFESVMKRVVSRLFQDEVRCLIHSSLHQAGTHCVCT